MLSLRLFGGLALSGSEGPISGRATQRRRLAVLAVLAHARGRPVSRDKLVALFWPETNSERARHLLADSIYVLRDALGSDLLLTPGDDVALNLHLVTSDLEAFFRHLEAGEVEAAVAGYADGGPFLDGVHLSDAPEFERWVEATRSELAQQYRQALEQLARAAVSGGDRESAIRWWRRLAASDPLSSRAALGLMRALAEAGDVAGALDFFRTHERMVRADLEVAPDPSVVAYAEELRRGSAEATTQPRNGSPLEEPAGLVTTMSPPTARPRPLLYAVATLAVVLLAGAGFLTWRVRPGRPPAASSRTDTDPSIIVIPLEPADPGDAALADGLTDELIAVLARAGHLRVISHTSAFAFKGRHMDVRQIADSLRVSHVLEGTLQRVGPRLRVQLQLVDGRDGTTRWSELYNRELKDVFAVQDDIAAAVTHALSVQLGAAPRPNPLRHQTKNIAAYELFLRGVDPLLSRSDSGIHLALDYLGRAVATDAAYAAAYAGISYRYTVLGFEGTEPRPRRAAYARAEEAARKALALDDSLGEAHLALGFVRMRLLDFATAEQEFGRAQALDPTDALIRETLIFFYGSTRQYAGALMEARRALEDDPLSAVANAELAHALLLNDRCDEALSQLAGIGAIRPALRRAGMIAARCYIKQRKWPEAIERLRPISADAPVQALLAYALGHGARRDEARQVLDSLLARWRRYHDDAFEVGVAYAGMGEWDRAFTWLDRSVDELSLRLEVVETTLDDVRSDPRWERLRHRLGLPGRTRAVS
jgi:DNA-binding SARP family transcriptional activator/TolB-like protein